jgi:hypothetical protein
MKHIRSVSNARASAYTDFIASKQRAWNDFIFAKNNQTL